MMSRKKKTQHIGHDPLAWLAENDPASAEDNTSAIEPQQVDAVAESTETDAVTNNTDTDSLAMENHAAPVAPTDNTDNTDETETGVAVAEGAEKAPAADAETVAASTESSVITVNAENAHEAAVMNAASGDDDDTADDLVASSDLETDSAASLLAIEALDEDTTDEAEQQTFTAHTLISDIEYPTEIEFSEQDFTTNMRTEPLLSGWTAVNLPSVLTLSELSDLYQQLSSLRGQRIRLSGENVSRIDTASLQLLVALMRDEETTVGWTNVSPVLCNSAQILGLAGALNLNGCELETE